MFTKWGHEWCIIRWRQAFFKRLLDWLAKKIAQGTGCQQGAIIQFGVLNPHLCSKSLNIYLKQGCIAETRHQFLFQRVSSLQLSVICTLSWIWNFRSLSWSDSCIECPEYLTFEWVNAMSKPLYIYLQSSNNPCWEQKGKLNKLVGESSHI